MSRKRFWSRVNNSLSVGRVVAIVKSSTNLCLDWIIVERRSQLSGIQKEPNYLYLIMSVSEILSKIPETFLHHHSLSLQQQGYDCIDHNNSPGGGQQQPPQQNSNQAEEASLLARNVVKRENLGGGGDQIEDSRIFLPQQQMFPEEELNKEESRLKTFDNPNWNVPFLDKRKLAQIGLYYLGTQDVVKCKFCKVEIGKWEQDDDCFTEHYRWSSNCPLLRRHPTDNVPIDADALDRILPPVTYDTCGPSGGAMRRPNAYAERSFTPNFDNEQASGSSSASDDETPFAAPPVTFDSDVTPAEQSISSYSAYSGNYNSASIPAPPSFYNVYTTPHLEIEANRLKTFKEWPINLKMKPRELSDAGFFYTGMGDRVQCFSCGGGLKNWEDDDVALEQHALWYGNCEYLKLIKGQKYIDAVLEKHKRLQERNENEEGDEESEEVEEEDDEEQLGATSSSAVVEPMRRATEVGLRNTNSDRLTAEEESSSSSGTTKKRKKLQKSSRASRNCDAHPESDLRNAEMGATSPKSEVPESKTCKICFECEFNTAFIPCGHVVACAKCASAVTKCPMCREPFDSVTRIYFS